MLPYIVEEYDSLVVKLAIQRVGTGTFVATLEEDDNEDNIDGAPPPKRRHIEENDSLISSETTQ